MFNISQFLNKLTHKPSIKFNEKKCLIARNSNFKCFRCVSNCSNSSLVTNGERLSFSEQNCTLCGNCFSMCPVQAFEYENFDINDILNSIKDGKIVITCEQSDNKSGKSVMPCLGFLNTNAIITIVLLNNLAKIDLIEERCNKCNCNNFSFISQTIRTAKEVLSQLKIEESSVVQSNSSQELISREEFLRVCREKVSNGFKDGIKSILEDEKIDDSKSKKEVNSLRKIGIQNLREIQLNTLAERGLLDKNINVPSALLGIGAISINDLCNGCGECTVFCPTGAIRKEVSNDLVSILHTPAFCLNCGLCSSGCKAKAISYMDRITLDCSINSEKTLYQSQIRRCQNCGNEITDVTVDEYCIECKNKNDLLSELNEIIIDV